MQKEPSTFYQNYITINPADIQANGTLTNNGLGANKTTWESYFDFAYTSTPQTVSNSNGILTDKFNTSTTDGQNAGLYGNIPITYYPSANINYDYITMIEGLSGQNITGVSADVVFENSSASQSESATTTTIYPNQIQYFTYSLAELNKMNTAKYNTSGSGYSSKITPLISVTTPKSSTTYDYTLSIYGIALTTNPLTIGTQTYNSQITTPNNFTGKNMPLTTFQPNFAWSKVINNGYSVATSQTMRNPTTQQNAISSGNYIEQEEYQGQFNLPTAPDLSYGPANLTEQFNVSTSQTQVLDINGVSYLSTISGKNGTIQLLSTVNPNSQIQFLQIVDYTQSQWNTISNSPGLFTLAGIEYYWWIAVGGLATLIGLGAAAKHAGTKADQERIRRGR